MPMVRVLPMAVAALLLAGAVAVGAPVPPDLPLVLEGRGVYQLRGAFPVGLVGFTACAEHGDEPVPGTVQLVWQPHGVPGGAYVFRGDGSNCTLERICLGDQDPGPAVRTGCFAAVAEGWASLRPLGDGAWDFAGVAWTANMDSEVVEATLRPVA